MERAPLQAASTPRGAKPFPVAEPENRGDDDEHDLVDRAGKRRDAERRQPAKPARDAAVPQEQPDGASSARASAAAVKSENCSVPFSQTGVGGVIATSSGAPPKPTRSVYDFGSHGASLGSLPPGMSGENRASAEAEAPGCRMMRAAVA